MLYNIFAHIIHMSNTATVVIAVVLILRGILGKMPKKYAYILWIIVGLRLICPVAISSSLSIYNFINIGDYSVAIESAGTNNSEDTGEIPSNQGKYSFWNEGEEISDSSHRSEYPVTANDQKGTENFVNQTTSDNQTIRIEQPLDETVRKSSETERESLSGDKMLFLSQVVQTGAYVWLGVCLLLVIWNVILLLRTRRRVAKAVRLEENIYECDNISTPFVLGFVAPKIYIPFRLEQTEREYIISHEKYHIKRKDNMVKLFAFFLCCVYWFNPFVWIAYFFMIRDMEMSCDEYVIGTSSKDIRKAYSQSLLGFATNSRVLGVGLLAFGESDTRKRVKHVMKYKTVGKWIGAVAMVILIITGICCLTDARSNKQEDDEISADTEPGENTREDEISTDMEPGESTREALKNQGWGEKQYVVLSFAKVDDYELSLVYLSGDKEKNVDTKPEDGYYTSSEEGTGVVPDFGFSLITSKSGKMCGQKDLSCGDYGMDEISFPAEGIKLNLADYDGDGRANDFSLGQGQMKMVELGNYMVYLFCGVEEDGEIVTYANLAENGISTTIGTVPGDYSRKFARKDGQLEYIYLGDGTGETGYASILRHVNFADAKENQSSQESALCDATLKIMPEEVVQEFRTKGVWTTIYDEENGEVAYVLENDIYEPTLRLEFTCDFSGNLLQYVIRDYGFLAGLSKENGTYDPDSINRYDPVIVFGKELLGLNLVVGSDVTKESQDQTALFEVNNEGKWNDPLLYRCYEDGKGNGYVVDIQHGIVVYEEPIQRTQASMSETDVPTGVDGAMIYYADENKIIFGGYFGIYEYQFQNKNISVRYLELEEIGCADTQGDSACLVSVTKDGNYVYLHPADSKTVYRLNMQSAGDMEEMSVDSLPEKKKLYQGILSGQEAAYTDSDGKEHIVTLTNWYTTVGDIGYQLDEQPEVKIFD